MKFSGLENYSKARISITQVNLRWEPGQIHRVHPATVTHPAVSPYIGNGLREVQEEIAETKVEPKAPVHAPVTPPPAEPPKEEPPKDEPPKEEPPADDNETAGISLREVFVEAPGITDANVDSVMGVFSTIAELATASKEDLIDLGVAKSYAKKLLAWADENK